MREAWRPKPSVLAGGTRTKAIPSLRTCLCYIERLFSAPSSNDSKPSSKSPFPMEHDSIPFAGSPIATCR